LAGEPKSPEIVWKLKKWFMSTKKKKVKKMDGKESRVTKKNQLV